MLATIMTTLAEIEAAAKSLPPQEQEALIAFLAARLERTDRLAHEPVASIPRRPGLHAGAWDVAPGFDVPLPDDFWLGADA